MYFKPIKPEQIQLAVNQLVKQSSSQSGGFSSADAQLHLLTQYSVWSETLWKCSLGFIFDFRFDKDLVEFSAATQLSHRCTR